MAGNRNRYSCLQRRVQLSRSAKTLTRTPLRPVSSAQRNHRDRMDELRPVVFARDGYRCQAQILEVCTFRADEAHHILPRGRGGTDTLENLVTLCWYCHRHVHTHPHEARVLGLLR